MKMFLSKKVICTIIAISTLVLACIILQRGSGIAPKTFIGTGGSQATITKSAVRIASGPGGPMLVISSASNPFSLYYAEILRAEGLNAFDFKGIESVSSNTLASYDVVILGEMPLTASQVTMLSDWVDAGGKLIAMRPDKKLCGLLGLSDRRSTVSDAYLLVDDKGPGSGITDQSIQFHGTADRYELNGAIGLATICSSANTATSDPAVTLNNVGSNGGQAAAFTYDLARSVVYTRQGNPLWAGQDRDGIPPIRSDDLFFGLANFDPQGDWVDPNKVAIPQADEQQRLLANLIIRMNLNKMPLPRFWYFPRGVKAVVIMTGDDHGNGGTAGRFDHYMSMSPPNCSVKDWECVRGTSYIYPNTPLSNEQASMYNKAGFEVAIHLSTECADWTPSSLSSFFAANLRQWHEKYSGLPGPVTNRVHCIAWSDYASMPREELKNGIRFDTNYYYWPPFWVDNRPGFFTGSGIPMRFADANGNLIDVYQAATQMTDESGQTYPLTIDTLLDRAIGPAGYYGAFVANIHTDKAESAKSDAIVRSAMARGIPVVSARQMLEWVDGRNASSFESLSWNGSTLSFTIKAASSANGLIAMAPVINGQIITEVTRNRSTIPFKMVRVKGIRYATFSAVNGRYDVSYAHD
jgi:hypothetical protein